MHRIAFAILALLLFPSIAFAQTPDPDDDERPLAPGFQDQQDIEGFVSAETAFESAGVRFTKPIFFSFLGFVFESDAEARVSFNQLEDVFVASMVEDLMADPAVSGVESTEESFPDIGDEQYAAMIRMTINGLDFINGLVAVRYREMIVVAFAMGLEGNMFEALEPFLIDTLERFEDARIENEGDLLAILPRLAEMPPGFIVAAGA